MFDAAAKERRADRRKKEEKPKCIYALKSIGFPPEHYGCAVVHSSIPSRALMFVFELGF